MKTTLYKASNRGQANYGWLQARYSFSFANYYDPERIHFGNLRVLNDDIIQGESGFGEHPHDNMEIVTISLEGKLSHKDSMGHKQSIGPNEVQVMSAGSGLYHSEFNNETENANILQIWILPKLKNIKPTYNQAVFNPSEAQNQWQFLVNGGESPLTINQDARISRVWITEGTTLEYHLQTGSYGSYLFLVDGEVSVADQTLNQRDALGISQTNVYSVKALKDSYLINIEI